jgi:hypothetical protein
MDHELRVEAVEDVVRGADRGDKNRQTWPQYVTPWPGNRLCCLKQSPAG